jgi:hypothetical protein
MNRKLLFAILVVLVLLFSTSNAGYGVASHPDRLGQVAHLIGDENNVNFGYSVAIAGDTVAIGDPYDRQNAESAGSVTIYQAGGSGDWVEITTISPADGKAGSNFGRNLAFSGDLLVVGAPGNLEFGAQPGLVYIFERNMGGPNHWGQVARLSASDAAINDNFGWAVSVDGDTVAVGAYTHAMGGRVYFYQRDAGGPGEWGETAQINADPPSYQACFGESLDLNGDLLAVGAYGGGDYAGYVYVFQRLPDSNQWQRLARFRAADTSAYHYFGYSVALDGWTILAGAPGADGLTGAAYIFTADPIHPEVWTEQRRLIASDGEMGDYFALELDLSADTALVGAPIHASGTGAAYIFSRHQGGANLWGEIGSIVGDNSMPADEFGYWTSVDGNMAVAGAPGSFPGGAAYIFDLDQPWLIHLPLVSR